MLISTLMIPIPNCISHVLSRVPMTRLLGQKISYATALGHLKRRCLPRFEAFSEKTTQ
jgi:hypothetical protein